MSNLSFFVISFRLIIGFSPRTLVISNPVVPIVYFCIENRFCDTLRLRSYLFELCGEVNVSFPYTDDSKLSKLSIIVFIFEFTEVLIIVSSVLFVSNMGVKYGFIFFKNPAYLFCSPCILFFS